jgi:hypothetical protein
MFINCSTIDCHGSQTIAHRLRAFRSTLFFITTVSTFKCHFYFLGEKAVPQQFFLLQTVLQLVSLSQGPLLKRSVHLEGIEIRIFYEI